MTITVTVGSFTYLPSSTSIARASWDGVLPRAATSGASGVELLDTIDLGTMDTYYELVDKRSPYHGESVVD